MFDVKTAIKNETLEVKLSGSLDIGGVDLFEEVTSQLDSNSFKSVCIDMQNMIFMDSTGIGALISFKRELGDKNFQFTNVNEDIKEIFSIIGIEDLFTNE
ncbi:STAS domain-containing protein [Effusibacillus dendaii]|uniref:Anti-sigma factor antagonist n=1 Tax=Effusibacillus dendaii TaxID=2743772 RepID=A0A7I8D4L5_9BACL|nr:STAS domain-containing protein [Effusibacillus dendaii]BCJ85024.1 anti-sigma factor antagonist [Effusibacillus dendaii]